MPPFRRQTDEPLYPKALWNRPVARSSGGRLLIVGGHRGDFSLPTAVYQLASAAGAGQITVAMPDVLRPLLAGAPDVVFLPSSASGSLGRAALAELIDRSDDVNAVVFAGLSNNSETTIMAEGLVRESHRATVLIGESAETLKHVLPDLASSASTLFILSLPQLFKLADVLGLPTKVSRTDLAGRLQIIRDISSACKAGFLIYGQELVAAVGDELIVTDSATSSEAALAGAAATFWVQNADPLTALSTTSFILRSLPDGAGTTDQADAIRRALDRF